MIPTHNSEKTAQSDVLVNTLEALTNYDFGTPHRHAYFEFFYFTKGGGNHLIDFVEFPVHDRGVHIVGPGRVHQMKRELSSSGIVFLFELDALHAPEAIASFLFNQCCYDVQEHQPTFQLDQKDGVLLDLLIADVQKLPAEKTELETLMIRNVIQTLCLKCMESEEGKIQLHKDNHYTRFRQLVHKEFREVRQVQEYAKILGMSEKSLNSLVKKNAGVNASQIIYNELILEAKRLLNTGISVKETAYELKFEDPAHFSKFFKSKTGSSPSDYRKVHG